MQHYIGTKIIKAKPMTRGQYNAYRGWTIPANEDPADDGYLVEYTDGGTPNHPDHNGYISWSPKEQFDGAYRETSGLTFGLALESLKKGKRVARAGWNGKNMWLTLATNWNAEFVGAPNPLEYAGTYDFIAMFTADKRLVPWLASQTDMLADDWQIV